MSKLINNDKLAKLSVALDKRLRELIQEEVDRARLAEDEIKARMDILDNKIFNNSADIIALDTYKAEKEEVEEALQNKSDRLYVEVMEPITPSVTLDSLTVVVDEVFGGSTRQVGYTCNKVMELVEGREYNVKAYDVEGGVINTVGVAELIDMGISEKRVALQTQDSSFALTLVDKVSVDSNLNTVINNSVCTVMVIIPTQFYKDITHIIVTPTELAAVTKELNTELLETYKFVTEEEKDIWNNKKISFDNTKPYDIEHPYNPAHKAYVDDVVTKNKLMYTDVLPPVTLRDLEVVYSSNGAHLMDGTVAYLRDGIEYTVTVVDVNDVSYELVGDSTVDSLGSSCVLQATGNSNTLILMIMDEYKILSDLTAMPDPNSSVVQIMGFPAEIKSIVLKPTVDLVTDFELNKNALETYRLVTNEEKELWNSMNALTLNGYSLWVGTTTELEAIPERDPKTLYFEIDDGTDDEVVEVNAVNGVLTLTTDKYQKTNMVDGTRIEFPSVSRFTEIHLYFSSDSDMNLTFPDCKWRMEPNIEEGKSYEIVATYNTIEWLVNVIVYS